MIQGLDKIQSLELRRDITRLYHELLDDHNYQKHTLDMIIYNYVLGMNRPICICDGSAYYNAVFDRYNVELLIDYRVTHGYKPYQSLDRPIHIYLTISRQIARDRKLNTILNDI